MGRTVVKPHNGGKWSAARFRSFITSALRNASNRWPPKYESRKAAKVSYGKYVCAGFNKGAHEVAAKDVAVDHILPVVDPKTGFVSWDTFIERLFCEAENFQVLCLDCHKKKSSEERKLRGK